MALGVGTLVRSRVNAGRSGYFPLGEIVRADGRKSWVVNILTSDGVVTDERRGVKSNQLTTIKDSPPQIAPANKPSSDPPNEESSQTIPADATHELSQTTPDPTHQPSQTTPGPTHELSNNATENILTLTNNHSPEGEDHAPFPDFEESFTVSDDEAGAEEETSDEYFNDEEPKDNELSAEDPNGDIDENAVELTNTERAERKKRYTEEKKALVLERKTFEVQESKKIKFRVGVEVLIKKGPHKDEEGKIVKKVSRLKWEVRLSDGDEVFLSRDMKPIRDISRTYVWEVLADVPECIDVPKAYEHCGVVGFDFDTFKSKDNQTYRELFEHLWPGDWKQQLKNLNQEVKKRNRISGGRGRKMKEVSKKEWWKFIGILIFGGAVGEGGEILWEKENSEGMRQPYNIGDPKKEIMSLFRFKEIKAEFPKAFWDLEAKMRGDPWHQILLLLDGFNDNRANKVASSITKVLDESMSAWKPRTTKTGGLPVLTFVKRKPEPLGTEFKCVADAETGIMLFLEVQRGKEGMKGSKYFSEHGATMSCTVRLLEGSSYSGQFEKERVTAKNVGRKEIIVGDSWFSSVQVAEEIALRGHEYKGPVSHSHDL